MHTVIVDTSENRLPSQARADTCRHPSSRFVESHSYAHVDHEASWLVSTALCHSTGDDEGSNATCTSSTRSPSSGSPAVPWTSQMPYTFWPFSGSATCTHGARFAFGWLWTRYSFTTTSEYRSPSNDRAANACHPSA